jgi:ribonuclease Z
MEVRLAGQVVEALSIGGVETCFQLPAFDCCLDIGRCPPGAIGRRRLLLTHAHMDHAAGLPYFVSMRAMRHLSPPKIYCPASAQADLQTILDAWTRLDADASRCELVGLAPGERVPLGGDALAETFAARHRVDTLGYCLLRRKKKLKAALHGLDGQAIAARARAGEDVNDVTEVRELCFPGDTGIEVVEREEAVRTARLLLLECTFLGERPGRRWAHAGGHVHLDDIAERAALFENEAILLTHFSTRYPPREIRERVDARLPASLRERVHLLLH